MAEAATVLQSGEYDVVVLDEAYIALYFGLFGLDELKQALESRTEHVEVVITGRYAPEELLAMTDLVTEMRVNNSSSDRYNRQELHLFETLVKERGS